MLERQIFISTLEGEWSLVSLDCGHWAAIPPDNAASTFHVERFQIDILDCSIVMVSDGEVVAHIEDVSVADILTIH